MGKDTFIIYKSFYSPISALSDKQLGRLFRAIFEYNISGVVSVEADIEMAFKFFKNQFDLDNDKEVDPISYNLNDTGSSNDDNVPEWIKAIQSHVAEN